MARRSSRRSVRRSVRRSTKRVRRSVGGGKRKLSPYNKFVAKCRRSGKSMKACAAAWRKSKK